MKLQITLFEVTKRDVNFTADDGNQVKLDRFEIKGSYQIGEEVGAFENMLQRDKFEEHDFIVGRSYFAHGKLKHNGKVMAFIPESFELIK